MIFALAQILATLATATLDSTPVALRFMGGTSTGKRIVPGYWADLGIQIDLNPAFLRYGFGIGNLGEPDFSTQKMGPGQSLPYQDGYNNSLAAGYQVYWKNVWMAAGAGWAWTIADTVFIAPDTRDLYAIVNGRTTRLGGSVDWIWKERLRKNGPMGILEAGFGLGKLGFAIDVEFGENRMLGWNIQYRFL